MPQEVKTSPSVLHGHAFSGQKESGEIVTLMFGQGTDKTGDVWPRVAVFIIPPSKQMTFAPIQKAPCLLCVLLQPANSISPGICVRGAGGGLSLPQLALCQLLP